MRAILIVMLATLLVASAQSQTIYDIQTGAVPENTMVQVVDVVVVAARYNGVYVSEAPHGAYNGIWVYTGGDPGAVAGDLVSLEGEYYEYFDLSEIDCTGGVLTVVGSAPVPAPTVVEFDYSSTEALIASSEPYESCLIKQVRMMTVTDLPDTYGEWWAWSDPALAWTEEADPMLYDDFWYDASTVQLGDEYCSVTGILHYGYGLYKLEPLADGIEFCPVVPMETVSFGDVKATYR